MQNNLATLAQPFIHLMHSNIGLLTRFSTSPEVFNESLRATQDVLQNADPVQQGSQSVTKIVQSRAFAELMQGLFRNYTEFLFQSGQAWMAFVTAPLRRA